MTNYASVGDLSKLINDTKACKVDDVVDSKALVKKIKNYCKIAMGVLFTRNDSLEIEIDDEKLDDSYTMAHIANGSMLDTDSENNLEDGRLEYLLIKKCSFIKRFELVKRILTGKLAPIDDFVYIGNCKKFAINVEKGRNTLMSYDGRAIKRNSLQGNIMNKKVRLVIPQIEE